MPLIRENLGKSFVSAEPRGKEVCAVGRSPDRSAASTPQLLVTEGHAEDDRPAGPEQRCAGSCAHLAPGRVCRRWRYRVVQELSSPSGGCSARGSSGSASPPNDHRSGARWVKFWVMPGASDPADALRVCSSRG